MMEPPRNQRALPAWPRPSDRQRFGWSAKCDCTDPHELCSGGRYTARPGGKGMVVSRSPSVPLSAAMTRFRRDMRTICPVNGRWGSR